MPDGELVLMMRPSTSLPAFDCSRQYAAAKCDGPAVPFRCTLMTASHSASLMLASMRSRRMPALLISTSRRPKESMACRTSFSAPAQSEMSSVLATASPPMALISSTTCWAGPASWPSPSIEPPRSFTTTFAPCSASISECSRPMPRPAPVTMQTRPSHNPTIVQPPWPTGAGWFPCPGTCLELVGDLATFGAGTPQRPDARWCGGMRAPPRRLALIIASVIAGLLVLLLGAWALDSAVLSGQVARNVRLDGTAVGGLSDSDLRVEVAKLADEYEGRPVHLVTPAGTVD